MKVDFIEQGVFEQDLDNLIRRSLEEDIGSGDHTSLSTIPNNKMITGELLVKDQGIIAGVDLAEIIFKKIDPEIIFRRFITDGSKIKYGDVAFQVTGRSHGILSGERLALNFMQRLSGIATKTNYLSSLIADYNTKLLDTRKTTPGLRLLEKWAVKIGGGINHRIGLYDMILVKDNHVDAAGSITKAVDAVQKYLQKTGIKIKVEVEIRSFEELDEVLQLQGVDRILLDNFDPVALGKAVKIVNGRIVTEASGGINESNIVDYAGTGVDFISSGALTNSVRSLDLSLKVV